MDILVGILYWGSIAIATLIGVAVLYGMVDSFWQSLGLRPSPKDRKRLKEDEEWWDNWQKEQDKIARRLGRF